MPELPSYWPDIEQLAEQIILLSTTVQRPLIEQHLTQEDVERLGPEGVIKYIEQFYTDEDRTLLDRITDIGKDLAEKHKRSFGDIMNDTWSIMQTTAPSETSPTKH